MTPDEAIEAAAEFYGVGQELVREPRCYLEAARKARRCAALILRHVHRLSLTAIARKLGYIYDHARKAEKLLSRATDDEWNAAALLLRMGT